MFRKTAQKPTTGPSSLTSGPNGITAAVTEPAPCEKSLRVQVGREVIAPVRAAVLAEFQREATLPGFRKGKVPAALLEREYAKPIREELLRRVTQQALEQVAKDHGLKPVGPFEVKTADLSETDGLKIEATVEVAPAFPLGQYKGIPLTQGPDAVTPEDIGRALTALQDSMAQLVPSGQGEAKERRVPALDDELARDLGYGTLEQLRAHVAAKLQEQKRTEQARAMESSLCDELLKRHAFQVSPRLVSRQTDRLTRDFKVRLLLSGTPEGELEAEVAKFTDELQRSAERHVKLTFLFDRIAEQESIAVSQDELVKRLWQLAQRWKKDPTEVRKHLDEQGLWPSVVSAIRQDKTRAFLMREAKVTSSASGGAAGDVPLRITH